MRSALSIWEPDWVPMVWRWGGRVINQDRTKAFLDEPEAVAGLQAWADMALVHHIAPRPGEENGSFGSGGRVFETLFVSESMNIASGLKDAFTPDFALLPAGPAGMFHVAGGVLFTVSSTTKYPEQAMKFAVWYAFRSNEWKLVGIPASLPTLRRDYLDYLRTRFSYPVSVVQAVSNPTEMEPSGGLYRNDILAAYTPLNEIARGEVSVLSGASGMNRMVNAVLSR